MRKLLKIGEVGFRYLKLFRPFIWRIVSCFHWSTYQVETQEVEDLPGVVLLQDLFQGILDESWERLGRVLQGVAHEVVQRGPFRGISHQGPLLPLLGRGGENTGCCRRQKWLVKTNRGVMCLPPAFGSLPMMKKTALTTTPPESTCSVLTCCCGGLLMERSWSVSG